MTEKKERIITEAIKLFNEKGYSNVSLREIAKAANTTIGNLTYHFPQKENLLVSLLESLQTQFVLNMPENIHRAELLSYLLNSFLTAERNEKENPFYYKNIYEITRNSEIIERQNKTFQKELFEYYHMIFSILQKDHVIRKNITDENLKSLAYTIVLIDTTWLQSNVPYTNELLPDIRLAKVLSDLVYPLISEEYLKEFENLCREKGIGEL